MVRVPGGRRAAVFRVVLLVVRAVELLVRRQRVDGAELDLTGDAVELQEVVLLHGGHVRFVQPWRGRRRRGHGRGEGRGSVAVLWGQRRAVGGGPALTGGGQGPITDPLLPGVVVGDPRVTPRPRRHLLRQQSFPFRNPPAGTVMLLVNQKVLVLVEDNVALHTLADVGRWGKHHGGGGGGVLVHHTEHLRLRGEQLGGGWGDARHALWWPVGGAPPQGRLPGGRWGRALRGSIGGGRPPLSLDAQVLGLCATCVLGVVAGLAARAVYGRHPLLRVGGGEAGRLGGAVLLAAQIQG